MSMDDYEIAAAMISEYPDLQHFAGPSPETIVKGAEYRLGVQFPPTYRRFVLEFGAGSFGSAEIFGVIETDPDASGVPDVVWLALRARREWGLHERLLPIYDFGDGEFACLDLRHPQVREAIVVSHWIGHPDNSQPWEQLATDFGDFLLQIVRQQVDIALADGA